MPMKPGLLSNISWIADKLILHFATCLEPHCVAATNIAQCSTYQELVQINEQIQDPGDSEQIKDPISRS